MLGGLSRLKEWFLGHRIKWKYILSVISTCALDVVRKKGIASPLCPGFCELGVLAFSAGYPHHPCWHGNWATQAQNSKIWPLDMADINSISTNYIQLIRFKKKANSGCAVSRVLATHPQRQIPILLVSVPPAKNGISGCKSSRVGLLF